MQLHAVPLMKHNSAIIIKPCFRMYGRTGLVWFRGRFIFKLKSTSDKKKKRKLIVCFRRPPIFFLSLFFSLSFFLPPSSLTQEIRMRLSKFSSTMLSPLLLRLLLAAAVLQLLAKAQRVPDYTCAAGQVKACCFWRIEEEGQPTVTGCYDCKFFLDLWFWWCQTKSTTSVALIACLH